MGESEKIYSSYKAPPYRHFHQSYMAHHLTVPSYAKKLRPHLKPGWGREVGLLEFEAQFVAVQAGGASTLQVRSPTKVQPLLEMKRIAWLS